MTVQGLEAARQRILIVFAIQGIMAATLFMRMPDLQLRAQLSDFHLGLVLMGGPIGAMLTFSLASMFIERFGTRIATLASYPLMAIAAILTAIIPNGGAMFVLLAIFGAMNSLSNIAINVEADRAEAATGRRIMNACHGAWSVAFFIASSAAGIVRGGGGDPAVHLLAVGLLFILASLVVVAPMRELSARDAGDKSGRWSWPTLSVIAIVAFGLGAELLEGSSRVWATIFIRDAFDVPAIIESAALPTFILAMAATRLAADRVIDRFGARPIAVLTLAAATLGVAIIVAAPHAYVAILGFALAGFGASVAYPLMISAAAKIGDRPASENVAALTFVVQLVILISPVLIGALAEGFGVRAAFGALLPLLVVGLAMSRIVR